MTGALLRVEGVSKAFGGNRAVDGLSLTVSRREVVAVIGPNGAGKSTLFNLIAGELRADKGRVALADQDITRLDVRARWRLGLGRTFQITATFSSLSIAEQVELALAAARHGIFDVRRRLAPRPSAEGADLMARVGLEGRGAELASALAYGDRKRLEWALALAARPKLLLLDEPTAGMAPADRTVLMSGVVAMARQEGIAILFTEHDMDVVFEHADHIVVMDRGRELATGTPEAVRDHPDVRRVYLGEPVAP